MTPLECLQGAIEPALTILPPSMTSDAAKIQLVAIGLQESRLTFREQIGGPARGLWQFELGTKRSRGGMTGVYLHAAIHQPLYILCKTRGVAFAPDAMYAGVATDDVLAAGIARLLLWTDPQALPPIGDADAAWSLYQRVWRPGKPHPETWANFYKQAVATVQGD
jgi:hypothetical protein